MKTLLRLQELDLQIESLKAREKEIPKQKSKFDIHKKRLAAELAEREATYKTLVLEQKDCETDIGQKQATIEKYDRQLLAVKKNEEYQALLHEMDMLKKQIGLKEERILAIMVEMDDVKARLDEDRKRVDGELKDIDKQCSAIDAELAAAVKERESLEAQRAPLVEQIDPKLMARYVRIRTSKKTGAAVVPLNGEVCTGCHMHVPPQIVNELMAGDKEHICAQCGRILYHADNFDNGAADA